MIKINKPVLYIPYTVVSRISFLSTVHSLPLILFVAIQVIFNSSKILVQLL